MASSTRSSLLVFALAFAPLALAGESVEVQARRLALEGKKAFDTGDFATAIARYQEAYKLKAAPGLLFNLGQCHRKTGALEDARSYFKRYLETSPPEAQAKATEQVLTDLEVQLAEKRRLDEEQAARREAEEEAARRAKEDELRVAAARAEAEAAAKKLELELVRRQQAPPPPPPPITSRWWFWAGLATVVAAGATTAVAVGTAPRPTLTTFPDINAR